MPGGVVDKLLVLQDRDCGIRRIHRELKDIPARKSEIEQRLSDHRAALEVAKQDLKLEMARSQELEVEIESIDERIAKLRTQQMELKTNQEFRAMESEIDTAQKEKNRLEEQGIEYMERIEAAEAEIREKEGALKSEQDDVNRDLNAMDQRTSNMEGELTDLESQRQDLAGEIDDNWLKRYTLIFENKKDKALVAVQHGVCAGCHMTLPPQLYHDVCKEDAMVVCNYCGRLLCRG